MIDFHTHILPQIDDGSKSRDMTAQMLTLERQQGVTTVVATPHFYANREAPEDFLARRQTSVAQMPEIPGIQVLCGAEVAYFHSIGSSDAVIPLAIQGTRLLLVEMPFEAWSQRMVNNICSIPVQLGLVPVLAHVDRYLRREQLPRFLDTLAQAGVFFQCNAEALTRFSSRGKVLKLMERGYIHFLGSDCHNLDTRKPNLFLARQVIEKKLGAGTFTALMASSQMILNEYKK